MKPIACCLLPLLLAIAGAQTITNGTLSVALDEQGNLTASRDGRTFLTAPFKMGDQAAFTGSALPADSPFGPGKMLADAASGDRVLLLDGSPFVYFRRDARGRETAPPSKAMNVVTATFLLGCCAPQNERSLAMCLGKFDAMRVGPDSCQVWKGNTSIVEGVRAATALWFQNGRNWWIDPDSIYAQAPRFPLNEVRCFASFVTLTGQLNNMTDWAPNYPAERIELLRRTMPSHQLTSVRPIDYFQNDPARIWHLTYKVGDTTRHTVGLFNWSDAEMKIEVTADSLGLDPAKPHHLFEFWSKAHDTFTGTLAKTVPARSCVVLAINPEMSSPAVLSTSRHVTQGAVDLVKVAWENDALTGTSKVVGGDPYEIRIAPNGRELTAVTVGNEDKAAGVTATLTKNDGLVLVSLGSPKNRTVNWRVK